MPYEEDYKMWLEKALIRMNPDWVCDEMSNNEFTHNWCHQYCGEEDAYITTKCLHMYYHHIARVDRKTENSSEIPNNCEGEPQTGACLYCEHYEPKGYCKLKECSVSPNHSCDEYLEIEPYEVNIIGKSHEYVDGARAVVEDEPQTERSE